jgi:hypothetical protein
LKLLHFLGRQFPVDCVETSTLPFWRNLNASPMQIIKEHQLAVDSPEDAVPPICVRTLSPTHSRAKSVFFSLALRPVTNGCPKTAYPSGVTGMNSVGVRRRTDRRLAVLRGRRCFRNSGRIGIRLARCCHGAVGGVFCDATNQELSKSSCAKPRYRPGTSMDCK